MAVAAGAAAHAAVRLLRRRELPDLAALVVLGLHLLVGDGDPLFRRIVVVREMGVDHVGGNFALADGVGHQARLGGVADGEDLDVRCLAEIVHDDISALRMDLRGQEVEHGQLADGDDHLVSIEGRVVREEDLPCFFVVLLRHLGVQELRALFPGHLLLLAEGGGLLDVHAGDQLCAVVVGLAGNVHAHVACADDHDLLALHAPRRAEVDLLEIIDAWGHVLVALEGDLPSLMGAHGDHHEFVVFIDIVELLLVYRCLQMCVHANISKARQFFVQHLLGQTLPGDAHLELAAELVRCLV